MVVAVGDRAPHVTLKSQDGRERIVPDGEGANLLVFYRGDW